MTDVNIIQGHFKLDCPRAETIKLTVFSSMSPVFELNLLVPLSLSFTGKLFLQ